MIDKLVKTAQDNKKAVKIEQRPEGAQTKQTLIKAMKEIDPTLSLSQCGCVIDKAIDSGDLVYQEYVSGVKNCGEPTISRVLVEAQEEEGKEEVKASVKKA